jgi:hypothetical protein
MFEHDMTAMVRALYAKNTFFSDQSRSNRLNACRPKVPSAKALPTSNIRHLLLLHIRVPSWNSNAIIHIFP